MSKGQASEVKGVVQPVIAGARGRARLHVVHGWGGGVDRWINDFSAADVGVNYVLRPSGTRAAFAQRIELTRADHPETPLLAWQLEPPIAVTAITHEHYQSILQCVIETFGVDTILVSSLIGHSLDVFESGLPTVVVCHDYFPYCLGIVARFGEVCTDCDSERLGWCLSANELHPFRGMTSVSEWTQLRERYLECLARPGVIAVAPDSSVVRQLRSLDERFAALNWRIIPHGMDTIRRPLSCWADSEPCDQDLSKRPLRVLVLGRLNPHKGQALLRELAHTLDGEVSFVLLGCGRFGVEFTGLPTIERIIPDYTLNELDSILESLRPDCGLLLSNWPETFSYTLGELWASSIVPVATSLGAFASRIEDGETGILVPPDASAIAGTLRGLREQPQRLADIARRLGKQPVRTVHDMVLEYQVLLGGARSPAEARSVSAGLLLQGLEQRLQTGVKEAVTLAQTRAELQAVRQDLANRDLQLEEARQIIAQGEALLTAERMSTIELEHRIGGLQHDIEQLRLELERVYSSHSWRLTGALRSGARVARGGLRSLARVARLFVLALLHPGRAFRRLADLTRQPGLSGFRRLQPEPSAAVSAGASSAVVSAVSVSDEYCEHREATAIESRIRAIAFYLPQFHPIPENDQWWGRGFTEWTNVTRAVPQFEGHYQPHLPGELGFYDLRVTDVQKRQMELARNYGLHGFCYYYYWFSGRKLLERPLQQHLADPSMDFPFCVCWANENWTRRWDGKEEEVLIAQGYMDDDALRFIEDLAPVLADPRYIRVNGRPVLLVYRVDKLPDARASAEVWREYCRAQGIGEILLLAVQSFDIEDPHPFGFDAAVEFPPHRMHPRAPAQAPRLLNPGYAGQVLDYASLLPQRVDWPDYPVYKCVMPSWDNEARRTGRGSTFVNATPSRYGQWFSSVCEATDAHHETSDGKLVFINAWNEWAEGAHLEPDRRYGYGYLQATADVLAGYSRRQLELIESTQRPCKNPAPTAVILNLYYDDLWEEIAAHLANLESFDLYVSVRAGIRPAVLARILTQYPGARLYALANRGRDIGPFFEISARIDIQRYRYVCKIHSKRSLHRADGDRWREDLLDKLLGSPEQVAHILRVFEFQPDVGLIGPEGHLVRGTTFWGSNEGRVKAIAEKMGVAVMPESFSFFAGSMFWFRPPALEPLFQLGFSSQDFEPEAGQLDGTLAHAVERIFPLAVNRAGYKQLDTSASQNWRETGSHCYEFCAAK